MTWRRHLPNLILLITGTAYLLILSLLQRRARGLGQTLVHVGDLDVQHHEIETP